MFNALKKYLSLPAISFLCFLLSLLAKIGMMRIFLEVGTDKFGQILIAKNFSQGHGFTIDKVYINNLTDEVFVYAIGWPPLYSSVLASLLLVFKDNFMLACFIIDCLAAIVFFVYLRKLLLLASFPVWFVNIFLLYQGLFITEYTSGSSATDFLALSFFVAGFYYFIKMVIDQAFDKSTLSGVIIFFLATCFTRYQYIPLIALLLLLVIITGIAQKRKHWVSKAFFALGFIFLCYGSWFLYNQFQPGDPFYLTAFKKGFYPENVLKMSPFTVHSFINLHFYSVQLSKIFSIEYAYWKGLARWVQIPLLIAGCVLFVRFFLRRRFVITNAKEAFFTFGSIAAIGVMVILVLLSLFHHKYIGPPVTGYTGPPVFEWTYVFTGRYYALPILFIQIVAFWWVFLNPWKRKNILAFTAKLVIVLTISIEMLHGAYYVVKKTAGPLTPYEQIIPRSVTRNFILQFITAQKQKDSSRKIIITGFDDELGYLANLYGVYGLFSPSVLNNTAPKAKEPAILLVALRKNEIQLMEPFLSRKDVKLLQQNAYLSYYTLYVEPNTGTDR